MTSSFSQSLSFSLTFPVKGRHTPKDITPYIHKNPELQTALVYLNALCAPHTLFISVEQTFEDKHQDGWGNTFEIMLADLPQDERWFDMIKHREKPSPLEHHNGDTPIVRCITPLLKKMPHHEKKDRYWINSHWITPPSAHTLLMAKTYVQETQHRFS